MVTALPVNKHCDFAPASGKARIAREPSRKMSYRLDSHCDGTPKNSDENQVVAIQRKAKTKTREQGKSDQLP